MIVQTKIFFSGELINQVHHQKKKNGLQCHPTKLIVQANLKVVHDVVPKFTEENLSINSQWFFLGIFNFNQNGDHIQEDVEIWLLALRRFSQIWLYTIYEI